MNPNGSDLKIAAETLRAASLLCIFVALVYLGLRISLIAAALILVVGGTCYILDILCHALAGDVPSDSEALRQ